LFSVSLIYHAIDSRLLADLPEWSVIKKLLKNKVISVIKF